MCDNVQEKKKDRGKTAMDCQNISLPVKGIGVDIEDISRFKDLNLDENEKFLKKIFTQQELSYCFSKKNPAPHLAARFSCKEAVIKALQSAGFDNPGFSAIEILNDKKGIPSVRIDKKDFKNVTIKISLSHCRDKSLAFAVFFEDK